MSDSFNKNYFVKVLLPAKAAAHRRQRQLIATAPTPCVGGSLLTRGGALLVHVRLGLSIQ